MTNETGYTKAKIYNVALSLLLLQRQLINPEQENSNEAKVLNLQWDIALSSALADMNLTSTALRERVPLVAKLWGPETNGPVRHHWKFAYQYPSDCGFFRRILSHMEVDDKSSHIPKIVSLYRNSGGTTTKVIFTNHHEHQDDSGSFGIWIEYIPKDFPIPMIAPSAAMAIGARLAVLGAPLIVGKGAKALIELIDKKYVMWKAEAQQQDANESFFFQTEATMSEFVRSRLSSYGEGDVDV